MASTTQTETKTVTFFMGGPGSGKSFIRKRDFAGLKVYDSDQIMLDMPGYTPEKMDEFHHAAASELSRQIKAAFEAGETNICYDGTGSNAEKYVNLIQSAQANGYTTKVVYVRCPLRTALKRNAERSRVVPESVVRSKHATIATSFEIIASYADEIQVINNG